MLNNSEVYKKLLFHAVMNNEAAAITVKDITAITVFTSNLCFKSLRMCSTPWYIKIDFN